MPLCENATLRGDSPSAAEGNCRGRSILYYGNEAIAAAGSMR